MSGCQVASFRRTDRNVRNIIKWLERSFRMIIYNVNNNDLMYTNYFIIRYKCALSTWCLSSVNMICCVSQTGRIRMTNFISIPTEHEKFVTEQINSVKAEMWEYRSPKRAWACPVSGTEQDQPAHHIFAVWSQSRLFANHAVFSSVSIPTNAKLYSPRLMVQMLYKRSCTLMKPEL